MDYPLVYYPRLVETVKHHVVYHTLTSIVLSWNRGPGTEGHIPYVTRVYSYRGILVMYI